MVQRIVKLMGHARSVNSTVTVQVSYNGAEVLNTIVATEIVELDPVTVPQIFPCNALAQFETTTDITGQIPVIITVTGGTLFFRGFWMNYAGKTVEQQATDPNVPIDSNVPSTFTWVVTEQAVSHFTDPNFNTLESDGLSNLIRNGYPMTPARAELVTPELLGDWTYPVFDGDIVTFDFFVDPGKVVLS
jgi:hypothetical protein